MKNISKKKIFVLIATCLFTVLLFGLFNKYYSDQPGNVNLTLELKSENVEQYQVYFDTVGDKEWTEPNSVKKDYEDTSKFDKLNYSIPPDTKNMRIDFGTSIKDVDLKSFYIKKNGKHDFTKDEMQGLIGKSNDLNLSFEDDNIKVEVTGNDPYLEMLNVDTIIEPLRGMPSSYNYIMGIAALFLGFITAKSLTTLKGSIRFLKLSYENRKIVKTLSKNDFKNKFASSYLGIVWGFVNPFITIIMYCFVFQVALKQGDVGEVPFVLWFICGIIPWFFFSEALPSTTNVFLEYSYLVKKVVFKIEVLPTVKIISSLFVHIFFIAFIFIIAAVSGYYPSTYSLQIIYYLGAMIALVFSMTIFTSAVILFFRDLGQIINIIMNVGFWATPIGWQLIQIPGWAQRIFKLNPMYYIVTGYRDTFVDKVYFWQRPYETIYFWAFCVVVLLVGVKIFNKLKPHFSDVL